MDDYNNDRDELKHDHSVNSSTKSAFNKHIWGVDNPSIGHKVIITVLGVFLVLGLYATYTKGFFPSEEWMDWATPMVWILTFSFSGIYFWAYATGKIKLKEGQKKISPFILFGVLPLFLFFIFLAAIPIGAGRAYTLLYGAPGEKTIYVSKSEHSNRNKKCLQSKQLGTGMLREFCIKEQHYKLINDGDKMVVYGKVSWFGIVIERYNIHQ